MAPNITPRQTNPTIILPGVSFVLLIITCTMAHIIPPTTKLFIKIIFLQMCIRDREDSGYFHNNKKLANRKSVKNAVLELQNSYQKYFEENKERICETDYTDETFETEKITFCLLYTSRCV